MFCSECGNKLDKDSKFCDKCGAKVSGSSDSGVKYADNGNVNNRNYEQTKVYQILAYLGILWIAGLLCGDKDDENIKFHVGQGIILSIVSFVALIVVAIVNQVIIFSIFKQEKTLLGYGLGIYQVSEAGLIISGILYLLVGVFELVMMIIGIKNVLDKNKKELPIIGKFAFYK